MVKRVLIAICMLGILVGCDFFEKENSGISIARVNDNYLYEDDIAQLVTPTMSDQDSALVVNSYITRWATRQLLMDGAKRNISIEEQERLDNLVDQYRTDLYSQAYKDALVESSIDSTISDQDALAFYEQNKSNFRLNEELLKLRYIQIGETDYNVSDIKSRFIRYNKNDRRYLDSLSLQFKAQSLNDSVWVRKDEVISNISPINIDNEDKYLKKSEFLQLRDSLGLYLIAISDKLERNNIAPIEYVMPTVKQIMINKKKLELIKKLEKDITKDAIKNKQFEIFN